MTTKAGRVQLKDLKQGKQIWMVQTRAKPVYDHIMRCDLPNIRMVKVLKRPVNNKRMSIPPMFMAYDLVIQETIHTSIDRGCVRMFAVTENYLKQGKRLLVISTISAPTLELFSTRKAAERFLKKIWRHKHKYLVQNDAFNLGMLGADFDGYVDPGSIKLSTHDENGKPVDLDVFNMFPGLGNIKALNISNASKVGNEELPRQDRIHLAGGYFGLYTLGLATTESGKIDEDCAMDNMRVPFYVHQLTDAHKEYLDRLKAVPPRQK